MTDAQPAEPSAGGCDERLSNLLVHELEDCFPGQKVDADGLPNRPRREMHLARGMVRAAERGDFAVASVYLDRLYRIPRLSREDLRSGLIVEAQVRRPLSGKGAVK